MMDIVGDVILEEDLAEEQQSQACQKLMGRTPKISETVSRHSQAKRWPRPIKRPITRMMAAGMIKNRRRLLPPPDL